MGQHLGVRGRGEGVTGAQEAFLDPVEVLNDPVVHDRESARAIRMRMGVLIARRSVRGPAGVADAGFAGRHVLGDQGSQTLVDAALAFAGLQRRPGCQQTDAGAVVTPVFQTPQAFDQDRTR